MTGRTRSQIQLPDNPAHFNRSPLKEARAAARIQHDDPSSKKRSPLPVSPARAKRWKPDPPRKRSNTFSKPASFAQPATRQLSSPPPTIKERARSVPLFSTVSVPEIDFRNPPRSPVRSTSPSRETLRIKPIKESSAEDSVLSTPVHPAVPSLPLSPLTPIPETPFPTRTLAQDNRYAESWDPSFKPTEVRIPPYVHGLF